MEIITILAVIIAIVVFLTIITPWVIFLAEEYIDWVDDVIDKIREKRNEREQ